MLAILLHIRPESMVVGLCSICRYWPTRSHWQYLSKVSTLPFHKNSNEWSVDWVAAFGRLYDMNVWYVDWVATFDIHLRYVIGYVHWVAAFGRLYDMNVWYVGWVATFDMDLRYVHWVAVFERLYHMNVRYVGWVAMGWLRLVGSLKWKVSFAKETYKRDDILQKRPVLLRSLLIVATPYLRHGSMIRTLSCCLWKVVRYEYTVCRLSCLGWLRLVGSLKWKVSLAEYSLFYRALLQKRPVILRSLLIVATPYLPYECCYLRYGWTYVQWVATWPLSLTLTVCVCLTRARVLPLSLSRARSLSFSLWGGLTCHIRIWSALRMQRAQRLWIRPCQPNFVCKMHFLHHQSRSCRCRRPSLRHCPQS